MKRVLTKEEFEREKLRDRVYEGKSGKAVTWDCYNIDSCPDSRGVERSRLWASSERLPIRRGRGLVSSLSEENHISGMISLRKSFIGKAASSDFAAIRPDESLLGDKTNAFTLGLSWLVSRRLFHLRFLVNIQRSNSIKPFEAERRSSHQVMDFPGCVETGWRANKAKRNRYRQPEIRVS